MQNNNKQKLNISGGAKYNELYDTLTGLRNLNITDKKDKIKKLDYKCADTIDDPNYLDLTCIEAKILKYILKTTSIQIKKDLIIRENNIQKLNNSKVIGLIDLYANRLKYSFVDLINTLEKTKTEDTMVQHDRDFAKREHKVKREIHNIGRGYHKTIEVHYTIDYYKNYSGFSRFCYIFMTTLFFPIPGSIAIGKGIYDIYKYIKSKFTKTSHLYTSEFMLMWRKFKYAIFVKFKDDKHVATKTTEIVQKQIDNMIIMYIFIINVFISIMEKLKNKDNFDVKNICVNGIPATIDIKVNKTTQTKNIRKHKKCEQIDYDNKENNEKYFDKKLIIENSTKYQYFSNLRTIKYKWEDIEKDKTEEEIKKYGLYKNEFSEKLVSEYNNINFSEFKIDTINISIIKNFLNEIKNVEDEIINYHTKTINELNEIIKSELNKTIDLGKIFTFSQNYQHSYNIYSQIFNFLDNRDVGQELPHKMHYGLLVPHIQDIVDIHEYFLDDNKYCTFSFYKKIFENRDKLTDKTASSIFNMCMNEIKQYDKHISNLHTYLKLLFYKDGKMMDRDIFKVDKVKEYIEKSSDGKLIHELIFDTMSQLPKTRERLIDALFKFLQIQIKILLPDKIEWLRETIKLINTYKDISTISTILTIDPDKKIAYEFNQSRTIGMIWYFIKGQLCKEPGPDNISNIIFQRLEHIRYIIIRLLLHEYKEEIFMNNFKSFDDTMINVYIQYEYLLSQKDYIKSIGEEYVEPPNNLQSDEAGGWGFDGNEPEPGSGYIDFDV